jgi:hypothetical protein
MNTLESLDTTTVERIADTGRIDDIYLADAVKRAAQAELDLRRFGKTTAEADEKIDNLRKQCLNLEYQLDNAVAEVKRLSKEPEKRLNNQNPQLSK